MTAELITILITIGGAVGTALLVFAVVLILADRPIKAFFVALMLSYMLTTILIYILNRLGKKRTTENRYE
jgi:Kef-type K+ transport system membrane component KefB